MNLTEKLIAAHLVSGDMKPGEQIAIKIDQTLTQDSTGTMAYLQFEAMDIDRVKTKKSVAYIDHNMLQESFENADDHKYIQSVATKHGIWVSRPGNGICHQTHLERFTVPGDTLLGSDSHTPTAGGVGMLAIGAGGLDVAVAMGGGEYYITMPKVYNINLTGALRPMVSAKDVILEVLRRLTVKGSVGCVMEYTGEGVKTLTVPERATITNMGAELGATTSIFPSDDMTESFFRAQNRLADFRRVSADEGAKYDMIVDIALDRLVPLAACPHSPDNVKPVSELAGMNVDQVAIGSCTNSSFTDMMKVAQILDGRTIAPNVSLVISPGTRQVLTMLAENGALAKILAAGARVLECGCGPCIGMGQAPCTNAVSLRTFNRNFCGRSGTPSANVYLVSPETAALSALAGRMVDPTASGARAEVIVPEAFRVNDNMILPPAPENNDVEVVRGPNIKPFPVNTAMPEEISGKVLTVLGDNITTDHIMPSTAKLLPYRSNIPYLSEFCLVPSDPDFPKKAKASGGGFIVGGQNYGQGSSREHAALAPLYLGVKGVIAKSFARIHADNLINNGILPLISQKNIPEGAEIVIENARFQVENAVKTHTISLKTGSDFIVAELNITKRQADMLLAGGRINYVKERKNAI